MSDIKDPTNSSFASAEAAIRDLMASCMPSLITKAGSVVRELVVRPFSYIYAAIKGTLDAELELNSARYLKTSAATDTEAADIIASNYFTERLQEIPATGIITMEFSSPVLSLPSDTRLYVDGIELSLPVSYIATVSDFTSADPTVVYVKAYKALSETGAIVYTASFPVTAASGSEVGVGARVTHAPVIDAIDSAWVSSPITGGRGVETDAELLARCAETTANAGVGSLYGVSRMLKASPYNVLDLNVVFGESDLLTRSRYNTTNINPGGFVDCYVKTANQTPKEEISVMPDWLSVADKSTESGNCYEYTITLPASISAGVLSVDALYSGNDSVGAFSTEFLSSTDALSSESARLSAFQKISVVFTSAHGDLSNLRAVVSRIPKVQELTEYVQEDSNRFVGQDVLIKCAVPVSLSLQCGVTVESEDQLDKAKEYIVSMLNQKAVGDCEVNFSDIRKACASSLPGVDLRLPCSITCVTTTKSGNKLSMTTETGVFSLTEGGNDQWPSSVSFLSTSKQNIRLSEQ